MRNAKLRLSRKLIFASGLLVCFSVKLNSALRADISTDRSDIKPKLTNHIRNLVKATPLEILAQSMQDYGVSKGTAEQLFGAYAEFLNILNDKPLREALEALRAENSRTDQVFQKIRKISGAFEEALDDIFFRNELVAPLTRKYGVF